MATFLDEDKPRYRDGSLMPPTPGPWRFLRHDGVIVHDQDDRGAREIGWNDADYMLAAAAPDMLRTLKMVHDSLRGISSIEQLRAGHELGWIKAAIVKAEGL